MKSRTRRKRADWPTLRAGEEVWLRTRDGQAVKVIRVKHKDRSKYQP